MVGVILFMVIVSATKDSTGTTVTSEFLHFQVNIRTDTCLRLLQVSNTSTVTYLYGLFCNSSENSLHTESSAVRGFISLARFKCDLSSECGQHREKRTRSSGCIE